MYRLKSIEILTSRPRVTVREIADTRTVMIGPVPILLELQKRTNDAMKRRVLNINLAHCRAVRFFIRKFASTQSVAFYLRSAVEEKSRPPAEPEA